MCTSTNNPPLNDAPQVAARGGQGDYVLNHDNGKVPVDRPQRQWTREQRPGRPPIVFPGVTIEKGVPVPFTTAPGTDLPFAEMAIGDSFFIACKVDVCTILERVRRKSRDWRKKQCPRGPHQFMTMRRRQENHGEVGVRCWRTA